MSFILMAEIVHESVLKKLKCTEQKTNRKKNYLKKSCIFSIHKLIIHYFSFLVNLL